MDDQNSQQDEQHVDYILRRSQKKISKKYNFKIKLRIGRKKLSRAMKVVLKVFAKNIQLDKHIHIGFFLLPGKFDIFLRFDAVVH